jgi:hypothetical protein
LLLASSQGHGAAEELHHKPEAKENQSWQFDELEKEKDGHQSEYSRSWKQDKIGSENSCDGTAGSHSRHDGGRIREDM